MTAVLAAIHALEDDLVSILHTVDLVLAALPTDDPLRSDLEEIRAAAALATARTSGFVVQTASTAGLATD